MEAYGNTLTRIALQNVTDECRDEESSDALLSRTNVELLTANKLHYIGHVHI